MRTLLLCLMLLPSIAGAALPAVPRGLDLQRAWSDYLATSDNTRPAMEFPHQSCFERSAARHELPVTLLLAMARGESNFDTRAISKANARGLMQIQWPGTAAHLGIKTKAALFDPCTNVDAGARYIKQLMKRYDGDLHLALAAYNYGPGRIRAGKPVPKGAASYSGYIFNHLKYVSEFDAAKPKRYADENQLRLLTFHRSYRAEAFLEAIKGKVSGVRIDWFKKPRLGLYEVVLLFANEKELRRSKRLLKRAGFPVPS